MRKLCFARVSVIHGITSYAWSRSYFYLNKTPKIPQSLINSSPKLTFPTPLGAIHFSDPIGRNSTEIKRIETDVCKLKAGLSALEDSYRSLYTFCQDSFQRHQMKCAVPTHSTPLDPSSGIDECLHLSVHARPLSSPKPPMHAIVRPKEQTDDPHLGTTIYTNLSPDNLKVRVLQTGISNHSGQLCSLYVPTSVNNPIISTYRNTNFTNLILLKSLLGEKPWENVKSTNDVNEAHGNLLRTLTLILNHTCPSNQSRCNKKQRALCDAEARRLKRCSLKANDRYLLTGILEDKLTANACKKIYDLKLSNLRRMYSMNHIVIADNKSKAIWDIISSELNSNKALLIQIKSLVVEYKELEDPMDFAHHFNHYFTTIAEESRRTVVGARNLYVLPNSPACHENSRLLEFRPTDGLELAKIIFSRVISYTTENS
ncbi:hypothetical protein J6590_082238 [Homalodisca vitripennis]|nr:hypothetical protein J6590_082238 [Homalodisca vitripennis]